MTAKKQWTCVRCGVTTTWMEGASGGGQPETWSKHDGELHCLGCRRAAAADAVVEAIPEGSSSSASRAQARRRALLEFEIRRVPERANSKIAASCRTSVPAVVKARKRIGVPAPPPPTPLPRGA